MYWEGRSQPDVEAPLGDSRRLLREAYAGPERPGVVEDGDSYNCYWRMPFQKSARIEVINQSRQARPPALLRDRLDQEGVTATRDAVFLRAVSPGISRCGQPGPAGQRVPDPRHRRPGLLRRHRAGRADTQPGLVRGRRHPHDHRWRAEPIYLGHGHRDYFLSAWGQKVCLTPYFGTPYLNHRDRDVGQMSCCYRWHVRDPIAFTKSLRVTIETMAG